MIHHTVIIPHRNAPQDVIEVVPAIVGALGRLGRSFEVIVVDDGSPPASLVSLRDLLTRQPELRLLRLDQPNGLGAVIAAAITVARGEVIVAFGAGHLNAPEDVPRLIERLARADAVFGCRRVGMFGRLVRSIVNLPRRLTGASLVRDPHCLLWAARREAVEGLDLTGRRYRRLPRLVAATGYRVSELHVSRLPARSFRQWFGGPSIWRWGARESRLVGWLWPTPAPSFLREIPQGEATADTGRQLRIDPAPSGQQRIATRDRPCAEDRQPNE